MAIVSSLCMMLGLICQIGVNFLSFKFVIFYLLHEFLILGCLSPLTLFALSFANSFLQCDLLILDKLLVVDLKVSNLSFHCSSCFFGFLMYLRNLLLWFLSGTSGSKMLLRNWFVWKNKLVVANTFFFGS